jgi:PTS system cellobiose-specific IIC component
LKQPELSRAEAIVASMEARLFPVLHRISEEPHMAAVREAMTPSFFGLIAVTIGAFLIPPEWTTREGYSVLTARFFAAYHIGFGAMGIVLVVLLADRLGRTFEFNRVVAALVSLGAFVSALKWPLDTNVATELGDISSTSILLGLVVALTTGEILRFSTAKIRNTFLAHAAGSFVIAVTFGSLAALHVSLGNILLAAIRPLVSVSDTLPGLLIVVFFQTLLWTAGIHGPAFLSGITTPVFLKAMDENSQAFAHHQMPPHVVTIMLSTFYFPGGSGATLSLALLMMRSRVARLRKLAFASLVPNIWNVNEVLIFGVPLVMNPTLTIPFLLVPLVLATVTYVAIWLGIVGHTVVYLPPVLPSVVMAWLTTAYDWRAVALTLVNIAIGVAVYTPFLRAYERTVMAEPSAQERLLQAAEAIREHERDIELHPEHTVKKLP